MPGVTSSTSWAPFQLATDFGAVFLELSLFSVPILSHFCESLHGWFFVSRSGCAVKLQVGAGGSLYLLSQVLFMQAMLRAPLFLVPPQPELPIHTSLSLSVTVLCKFSYELFRACKNVLKSEKGSYCGGSKPLLEIN